MMSGVGILMGIAVNLYGSFSEMQKRLFDKNLCPFIIKIPKKHKIKETYLDIKKPIGVEHSTLLTRPKSLGEC